MRWLKLHRDAASSIKADNELRSRISAVEEELSEVTRRIGLIERAIAGSSEKLHSTVIETYCDDLADHGNQMGEFEILLSQLKSDLESLQTRIASKLELAREMENREQQREEASRLENERAEDASTQFLNRTGGSL
jgi:hypothetical protein